MAEVVAERPAFADDEIARLIGPMNARIIKVARVTAGGFLLIGLIGAGFALYMELSTPPIDTQELVGLPIIAMFFGGLLPAFAVHRMICADLKTAPRLLREGTRHSAQVTGVSRIGTMYEMTLEWSDERGPHQGGINVEFDPSPRDKVIEVWTRTNEMSIGTIVDDRMYVGIEWQKKSRHRK